MQVQSFCSRVYVELSTRVIGRVIRNGFFPKPMPTVIFTELIICEIIYYI